MLTEKEISHELFNERTKPLINFLLKIKSIKNISIRLLKKT